MSLLNRDGIFGVKDKKIHTVFVPEWGGEVGVRMLSAAEKDAWEASITVQSGRRSRITMENLRARLVALCVCDEAGRRLFSDDDIPALGEKSAKAMELIFDVAREINGMNQADMEELVKNSGRIPAQDSHSD